MKKTKSLPVLQKWSRTNRKKKKKRKSQRRIRVFLMTQSATFMIPMKRYRGPHWVWFNIVSTSIKHTKIKSWIIITFQIRSLQLLLPKTQIRRNSCLSNQQRKRLESWKKTHIRVHSLINRWTSIKVDRKVCFITALYLLTKTTKVPI